MAQTAKFRRKFTSPRQFNDQIDMHSHNPDGWSDQDFIDQPEPIAIEDDPLDPLSLLRQRPSPTISTPLDSNPVIEQTPLIPVVDQQREQRHLADMPATPWSPHSIEGPDHKFGMSDGLMEDDLDTASEDYSLEEPIPTAEFDPGLRDEVYQGVEFIDLSDVDIRLDLFLSGVALSKEEDKQIRSHLNKFSKARLSNWLPWLTSKAWAGRTLLLFVKFHRFWECNSEWWESRWRFRTYGWQPSKSPMPNILSRDDAYGIVHRRINLHPEEMIDPVWFEEWDYHSLWRHGFLSFAKFAKFRSALNDGEEWKSLILWRSLEEDIQSDSWLDQGIDWTGQSARDGFPASEDVILPYSHTASLPHWYHMQDWYPKHEWHGNLGWNISSVETSESRDSPDASQGPVWPLGGRNE